MTPDESSPLEVVEDGLEELERDLLAVGDLGDLQGAGVRVLGQGVDGPQRVGTPGGDLHRGGPALPCLRAFARETKPPTGRTTSTIPKKPARVKTPPCGMPG